MEEYEVLYSWPSDNPDDLPLKAGTTISVIKKNEHGWWLGLSTLSSPPKKGFFPKSYVRPKDSSKQSASEARLQVRLSTQIVSISARPFSINSIEAFDALVDNGVAVELKTPGNSGSKVASGSRVTLSCSGLIWDGANTIAQEYSTGTVSFTLGKNHVTPGLEEGVLQLGLNDEADIISAPLLAFGDAGQPPYIPPNVHLVYSVKVLAVSSDEADLAKAPEGDASILWSGIVPRASQDAANSAVGTKAKAVVLVMDGAVTKSREAALTDEQLAKAAKDMGMGK